MATATTTQETTLDVFAIAKDDPQKALELAVNETNRVKRELGDMRTLTQMTIGKEGLEATNSAQLWWLAGVYAASGIAPKDDTDVKINGQWTQRHIQEIKSRLFIKMSFGAELGIKPLQSIQNIAIINNRPCIWGDAAKALVINSGLCEYCREEEIGTVGNFNNPNPAWGFVCKVKRKGQAEESYSFTWGDAKLAGLIDKNQSLYKLYPKRMLMFRARGFRLRDTFPDVLKGLITAEEARDIDLDRDIKDARPTVQELLDGPEESTYTPRPAADADQTDAGAQAQEQTSAADGSPATNTPDNSPATPEAEATAQAPRTELTEDELFESNEWREVLKGYSSISDVEEAKTKISPNASKLLQDRILLLCAERIAQIRGGRGPRSSAGKLFDAKASATERGQ